MTAIKIVMGCAAAILVLMMIIGGGVGMAELYIADACLIVLIVGTIALLYLSSRPTNGGNE